MEAPAGHIHSAWRAWLSALDTDAEAALATGLVYDSLPPEGRDAWLDALESDRAAVEVPILALYAPLLAAESDSPERRGRIEAAIRAAAAVPAGRGEAWALRGIGQDGMHVCVVVAPLYLRFVQRILCRYTPGGGFVAVEHQPMLHADQTSNFGAVDGVALEPTSLPLVIEELALAILADRRQEREPPPALVSFAHLF